MEHLNIQDQEIQSTEGKRIRILTPKQMLPRLPIALAQVKAENTSQKKSNKLFALFKGLTILLEKYTIN